MESFMNKTLAELAKECKENHRISRGNPCRFCKCSVTNHGNPDCYLGRMPEKLIEYLPKYSQEEIETARCLLKTLPSTANARVYKDSGDRIYLVDDETGNIQLDSRSFPNLDPNVITSLEVIVDY